MAVATFILRLVLTVVFLAAGCVKLHPFISAEAHQEQVVGAEKIVEVFKQTPIAQFFTTADSARTLIGGAEVLAAFFLWTPIAVFSELVLIAIMIGAVYFHLFVKVDQLAVPAVLLLLLVILLFSRAFGGKSKAKSS